MPSPGSFSNRVPGSVRAQLQAKVGEVDAGYPGNADLVIDDDGRPSLERRKGKDRSQSAIVLEEWMLEPHRARNAGADCLLDRVTSPRHLQEVSY